MATMISVTRDELMKRMLAAKERAGKDDERVKAKHVADENATLERFRDKLKDAAKWDYKKLKKSGFEVEIPYGSRPTCPTLSQPLIIDSIAELAMDAREKYTLSSDHFWIRSAMWMPASERAKRSACD